MNYNEIFDQIIWFMPGGWFYDLLDSVETLLGILLFINFMLMILTIVLANEKNNTASEEYKPWWDETTRIRSTSESKESKSTEKESYFFMKFLSIMFLVFIVLFVATKTTRSIYKNKASIEIMNKSIDLTNQAVDTVVVSEAVKLFNNSLKLLNNEIESKLDKNKK